MKLLELRQELARLSGRFDIVNEDGSDNGADFFINSGQRFLDKFVEKHSDKGRIFRIINPGDYFVKFQECRAIHEVGIGNVENFSWIDRYTLQNLRAKFSKPFEFMERSKPCCFAPAYLRPVKAESEDFDGIVGYMDVMEAWKNYNGIVLLPPADQQYHVEVWGKFYTEALSEDSDESFWSVNYVDVLIMAAQRAMEVFYRNTQGVNDWTNAIQAELIGIEKDFVEESYFDINQLEG